MSASLQTTVERFLENKRALGRKYHTEENALGLLVSYVHRHGMNRLDELDGVFIEEFLTSRPRLRPRSFNHLLGVVTGLFDWAVAHELLAASPLQTRRRQAASTRIPFLFNISQARQLLDAAAALPDNSRAQQRGPTYHTMFALCYGLGLRSGEACRLRTRDVDSGRRLLFVIGGKFGKSRLVPHGPASPNSSIATAAGRLRRQTAPTLPCSPLTAATTSGPKHSATPSTI